MRYKTPKALEMAVGEAARASVLDTNRAINNFCYHRLLVRVFSEDEPHFVLKGGLGMLARTVDARATSSPMPSPATPDWLAPVIPV